mgnify:CR=1 FL=1
MLKERRDAVVVHRARLGVLFRKHLTVDLSNLAKGQSLHVSDLKLAEGIKVVTHGKKDPVIVSVSMQAAEEEAAPAPVAAAPAAAPAKAKKDEKQNKK